jgi:HEAT repeat protein
MNRALLGWFAGAVAAVALAPAAFAHGGQYRTPGGSVPPGLREPSDPTPPPPPPGTTPPPTTTPPETPPPGTPTTPTTPTPPAPPPTTPSTPSDGPREARKAPTSYEQWIFWWNYNSDEILQIKESIYGLHVSPSNPLGVVGGASGAKNDATRLTEKEVKDRLIPAMRWAMDQANKQSPDTESAAYIGLAKVTDDPSDIALLKKAIVDEKTKDRPKNIDQIVNESAALALGLLRRSEQARQFDAKELDRVRDFCFEVFDNQNLNARTRCFAMLSIGLLGNQPTAVGTTVPSGGGLFYAPDPTAAVTTADHVFSRLSTKYKEEDSYVSLLMALSMQPADTIKLSMLEVLKECALKGKLGKENVSELVSAYAALALGRVGTAKDIPALATAMKVKATGANVKRSAAISLGKLGSHIDGADRANLAVELWKTMDAVKEASTRNFGIISLAYLVIDDVMADKTDVINAKGVKVLDELLKIAEDGRYSERPYGALALGLICRAIGDRPTIEAYGEFRAASSKVLRKSLEETKIDKRTRAAFAVALGMMKEEGAKPALVALVADTKEDNELRGYSAVALGMIKLTTPDVLKALKDTMREKSSEELRLQCAVALGLLGQTDAVPLLLKELDDADTQNVQGQIVIALAKIGDSRAIEPLVTKLKNHQVPDATRAICCAGLGLIGDLEFIPTLSRISKDINYRAACDVINEVLSIL